MKLFWQYFLCLLMAVLIAYADAMIKLASNRPSFRETMLSLPMLASVTAYLVQIVIVAIAFRMRMDLWVLMLIFVVFYSAVGLWFAWGMFGEVPVSRQWWGFALAIASVALMSK